MLFVVIGEAKPEATPAQIQARRQAYLVWCRGNKITDQCRTLARYEVVGQSPPRIFWIIDADNWQVIHEMLSFFSGVWQIQANPVIERSLMEAIQVAGAQ